MKNIFKSILTVALLAGLSSCEDESNLVYIQPAVASFQIITPSSEEGVELNELTPNNPAITLTWEAAQYSTPTSITYTVQIAPNGSDFSNAQDLISTTNRNAVITSGQINLPALIAGAQPNISSPIDVRIKATIAGGGLPLYSNIITYNITAYGCLPQYAKGDALSANTSWTSPLSLICDNEILLAKAAFVNGTFGVYSTSGDDTSLKSYSSYIADNYKIVSVLEDSNNATSTFNFTGTPGNYRIKIDQTNKTVGLAKSTVPNGIEPTSY